ncbi:hypothetical protein FBY12_3009 [Pseudomonas sp. SJZ131]|jgi:hypothetical protein|nr:hypothetical protein FBY12_3009 [Pseudomonas sp. SJZ131]
MAAYIDSIQGGADEITVSGRGTPNHRVYLHHAGGGIALGSGPVGADGNYKFTTKEPVIKQQFHSKTFPVQVRESLDNVSYSDWCLNTSVTTC